MNVGKGSESSGHGGGHEQLATRGYAARAGQMIDATFVEVPRQRNTRDENAQVKAGETPADWQMPVNKSKLRQKDVAARWTQKNTASHYGFKNHINVDQGNKLVQSYAVTDAAIHDSQVFEALLDHSEDESGKKRAIYADSAYRSQQKEASLATANIPSQICEKGARNQPLTAEQKTSNTEKSRVRVRVEPVFGAQAQMGGHIVRTIGLLRARVKIGMMNLVYNRMRLGQLLRRDGGVASAVA